MAKPKLICTLDGRVLGEHLLDKDKLTIGRRQNNDIVIDNLSVSGLHAVIVMIGKDAFLEDANSTNGTFVNLKPVRKHLLEEGDIIEIGRHQFKFVSNRNSASKETDIAKSAGSVPLDKVPNTQPPSLKDVIQQTKMASKQDKAIPFSDTAPMPLDTPPLPLAKLRFVNGANEGKTSTLSKTLTTLGKHGEQVIVITRRTQGYFLSQIEGTSPPHVNDQPIRVRSYRLEHQDMLEVAGVKMEFLYST